MLPQHTGFQDGLNLTISLCLVYTLCIAGLRAWIRRKAYGVDDFVIAAATLVTLAHTACDYVALSQGLGLPWTTLTQDIDMHRLNEATIPGVITFIIALYLSKCAMLSFLARITMAKSQIRVYHIGNGIVGVAGIISVLIAVVGCPTESGYYWAFHANRNSCPSQSIRWQAITGFDIMTEIIVLVLPVHLVWGLQMPTSNKARLIAAFYLRLPTLGFAIVRNYCTLDLRLPSAEEGLDSTLVVIWLEIQLTYALAASTVSALKSFTSNFNSRFGLAFTRGKGEGTYDLAGTISDQNSDPRSPRTAPSKTSSTAEIIPTRFVPNSARIKSAASPTETNDTLSSTPESMTLSPEHKFKCVTQISAEPKSTPPTHAFSGNNVNANDEDAAVGIFHERCYHVHSSPRRTYLLRP
ncbi:Hypothetical protein R9X50_00094700 [Acrodontium crateriforme]|uniref:Rhodopsin domain-containing protein n=1 Tax=Acrodontium crateriforme TaxID=150365 RepID=A0AAQ3LZ58_9PEZI|nr:Hypothetical protein R9X50_00094700 [Acrodontium crateriforme]